jgi:3-oxoacyl-[acyl-carrier protein] reductase
MTLNVTAPFTLIRELAPLLASSGSADDPSRVINIGSVNADSMPIQGGCVYAMTKAAMAGLTRGMARDLGPRGITVNVVQPGPIDTDMNPATGPFADLLMKYLAVPRYAQVDEVAAFVTYLAGPQAGYITGSGLNIDGGFDA